MRRGQRRPQQRPDGVHERGGAMRRLHNDNNGFDVQLHNERILRPHWTLQNIGQRHLKGLYMAS